MSEIAVVVTEINNVESLNIVNFSFLNQTLTMMGLELPEDIQIGTRVELSMKPTQIAIAKEFSGAVSLSNQLKAKIVEINNGKLLSSIKLSIGEVIFESIITLRSSQRMDLKIGDEVTAFVKASELSIKRVLQ